MNTKAISLADWAVFARSTASASQAFREGTARSGCRRWQEKVNSWAWPGSW
ncbi:MAG: hypothetical protein U0800_09200 [Isosphaeraceae bacterium]